MVKETSTGSNNIFSQESIVELFVWSASFNNVQMLHCGLYSY